MYGIVVEKTWRDEARAMLLLLALCLTLPMVLWNGVRAADIFFDAGWPPDVLLLVRVVSFAAISGAIFSLWRLQLGDQEPELGGGKERRWALLAIAGSALLNLMNVAVVHLVDADGLRGWFMFLWVPGVIANVLLARYLAIPLRAAKKAPMLLTAVVVMTFGGRLVLTLVFGVAAELVVNLLVPAAVGVEVLRVRRALA